MKTINIKDIPKGGTLINLEKYQGAYENLILNHQKYFDKKKKYYIYCAKGVKVKELPQFLKHTDTMLQGLPTNSFSTCGITKSKTIIKRRIIIMEAKNMLKIKTNSKLVEPGDTFVAIKGNTVDGHQYIEEAINKGARFIVAEHGEYKVPTLIVKDTTEYLRETLSKDYSKDFKDLKFIGITGTNGKTTTALLTSETLNELGESSAYIGTIGFYINGKLVRELPNTTPDILTLYNLIYEAKEQGVKYIVMEVSSHALSLGRIDGINFDVAAFTNLTEDHLDYHKTMEEYLKAKQKILTHLKPEAKMIVNNDDPHAKDFETENTVKIGKTGDIAFMDYEPDATGTKIWFKYFDRQFGVRTNMLCEFNIYNYLTSLGLVTSMGFDPTKVISCASKLKPPKGRNEIIGVNGARAIIDYAHTPDAVEK